MARALIVVGTALLGAALIWTGLILAEGSTAVGNLAGASDWIWVIVEAALKTGLLWAFGLILLVSGTIGGAAGARGGRGTAEMTTPDAPDGDRPGDAKSGQTLRIIGWGFLAIALVLTLRTVKTSGFLDVVEAGGALYWLGLGAAVVTNSGLFLAAGLGFLIAGRTRRR